MTHVQKITKLLSRAGYTVVSVPSWETDRRIVVQAKNGDYLSLRLTRGTRLDSRREPFFPDRGNSGGWE